MANTKIISPSALDRFFRCPFHARMQEFAPRQVDTVPQMLGKENHRVLELFFKNEELDDEAMTRLESLLSDSFLVDLGLFTDENTETGVEETFAINYGEYAIHGVKDLTNRVDDRALVIDWKTGKAFYRASDVEASLQGKIYALDEFEKNEDIDIVFFRIAMTAYQRVVGCTYYREDLEELKAEIKQAVTYFLSCHKLGEFPARPSSIGCGRCEFIAKCPHNIFTQDIPIIDNVNTDKIFSQSVRLIQVSKEYLTRLEDMVNEYAKAHTPDTGYCKINDVSVNIESKVRETVSKSKKSMALLEKYADKLGRKLNTGIKDIRKLPEEDFNKLKELGVIKETVTDKIKLEVTTSA